MAKSFGSSGKKPEKPPDELPEPTKVINWNEIGQKVADIVVRRIILPKRFYKASGRHLFGDRYRVNVFVENGTPEGYGVDLQIHKSYFVSSDGEKITSSKPPLDS